MKIALDIDGCISQYPEFFRTLSHALCGSCIIVVLTNRIPRARAVQKSGRKPQRVQPPPVSLTMMSGAA
jgi:hypothetical protein